MDASRWTGCECRDPGRIQAWWPHRPSPHPPPPRPRLARRRVHAAAQGLRRAGPDRHTRRRHHHRAAMTRDRLEAAIWQHPPLLTTPGPQDRQDVMPGFLTAAAASAAAEVGLLAPAER